MSFIRMFDPFSFIRGIAAGDVHQDGWSDLLVASESTLALYANQRGTGYVRQLIELPVLHEAYITHAALVDLNNDGWLDIFFSAYRAGNHVIYNHKGQFILANWQSMPNQNEAVSVMAAAFGDVDRDGDLDIALGNATGTPFVRNMRSGAPPPYSPLSSRNALLLRQAGTWQVKTLPDSSAETLTMFFTDINGDRHLDLLVGNDLLPPDYFFLGTAKGELRLVTRDEGLIPHSTFTTMSMTSADINNDLVPEVYIGHIKRARRRSLSPAQVCEEIEDASERRGCESIRLFRDIVLQSWRQRDAFVCLRLTQAYERQECLATFVYLTSIAWGRSQAACENLPQAWTLPSFLCRHSFVSHPELPSQEWEAAIPQVKQPQGNVLLMYDAVAGRFVDQAGALGVEDTGWTWNAKFADLDNDEWQDLYIVSGNLTAHGRYPNAFFHNQQGRRFADKSEAYGLASWLDMLSYTYSDIDHDGDLDIIAVPAVGPLHVYINEFATGHAIAFALRDFIGNRFGIGSQLVIHYGDGRHQMREMQAGGGFQSYDAPIVYFGLGTFDKVDRVEVLWSTGERSALSGNWSAGARYTITRRASPLRQDRLSQ